MHDNEPATSLVHLCARSCARFAERPLFGTRSASGWTWTSYGELEELVAAMRGGLASLGVGAGDKVAIVSANRVEWAVAAYATFGLGASFVPLYEAQNRAERDFILRDAGVRLVFGSRAALASGLASARASVPRLEHVVALDEDTSLPGGVISYASLIATGRRAPVPALSPTGEDLACIVYTSGTTGMPKGVRLTHGNLTANVAASRVVFPLTPEDRTLSFLPWAHAYGQVVEIYFLMSWGASTALNRDSRELMEDLLVVKPTMLVAVPRIFNRIYTAVNRQMEQESLPVRALFKAGVAGAIRKHRGEHLGPAEALVVALADRLVFAKIRAKLGGRLAYALTASATIERRVAETIDAMGIHVYEGYGLTETSPVVSGNTPASHRLGSVGKPIPGVRVTLDVSMSSVPGEGEIIVHGPNVMKGYHDRPDEDAKVMLPTGGFRTGDLGRFDEDGFLYVTGRIKEQYKLENGKYVMPSPLEQALQLSPFIANVMLYGANRPFNVALVVPDVTTVRSWAEREGITLGEDLTADPAVRRVIERELERCSASFRAYERPRAFVLTLDDFSCEAGTLTPTLKVKRRAVLERHERALEALYRAPERAPAPPPSGPQARGRSPV